MQRSYCIVFCNHLFSSCNSSLPYKMVFVFSADDVFLLLSSKTFWWLSVLVKIDLNLLFLRIIGYYRSFLVKIKCLQFETENQAPGWVKQLQYRWTKRYRAFSLFLPDSNNVFYKKTCVFQQKSLILHLNIEALLYLQNSWIMCRI